MRDADLAGVVDGIAAAARLSGVIRLDGPDGIRAERAYGLADRRHGIPNSVSTRFAIASGVKGMTAVTVMSLVADGTLALDTTARSVLGTDLPLIDERVTVEHLLAHRSGIGDYLDESAGGDVNDHVMAVPVHRLASTEDYLAVLDGYPQASVPGERFAYCNGGYVVLALIAERTSGVPFPDLLSERVLGPAGMTASGFLRSDELPGDTALGYLDGDGLRTNVLHLPVRGSGDGGLYSTAADIHVFWRSLMGGRLVPADTVAVMTTPRSRSESGRMRYGLGFWLDGTGPGIALEGYDAGVSFRSEHDPIAGTTLTVLANTSDGAWGTLERLRAAGLADAQRRLGRSP